MASGAIPAAATAPQLQQQPVLPEETRPNLLPMKLLQWRRHSLIEGKDGVWHAASAAVATARLL
jgi:hypothetical protein